MNPDLWGLQSEPDQRLEDVLRDYERIKRQG
jgi:hypothetical protein